MEDTLTEIYRDAKRLVQLHQRATKLFREGDAKNLSKLLKAHGFASLSEIERQLLKNFERIKELRTRPSGTEGPRTPPETMNVKCLHCYDLGYVVKREYIREDGFITPIIKLTKCVCQL